MADVFLTAGQQAVQTRVRNRTIVKYKPVWYLTDAHSGQPLLDGVPFKKDAIAAAQLLGHDIQPNVNYRPRKGSGK